MRGEKLRPIAERLAALLEARFGAPAPFALEAELAWMPSVPDPEVYRAHWRSIKGVYAQLVDGRYDLDERLAAYCDQLRYGAMRVDAFFAAPYGFAFEFDEEQHFNRFRALTLEHFPGYGDYSFDYDHYLALCRTTPSAKGTSTFTRLKSFDPLFPPFAEGEAQDNRTRQRAFRDFLKDVTPCVADCAKLPCNPTIRISYQLTRGRRGYFESEDLDLVEAHVLDMDFLDKIRLLL
jgi:hypothetical protein